MDKVVNVVRLPVVMSEVSLHVTPSAHDCVGMNASPLVNELYAMVDGVVCVISLFEMAVRPPAVTDDRSAGFDRCIYNGYQSVGGSVHNGKEKRSPGLALNIAKHALPLHRVVPAVFPLTELALLELYGLVRTVDLFRAALHVPEHGLSAELAPFREHIRTEAMLLFDTSGRFAAYDVVCEKHNFL